MFDEPGQAIEASLKTRHLEGTFAINIQKTNTKIQMNYVSISDLDRIIRDNLMKIPEVDLIVGIPRSGMIVANLLSLYLNKPFTEIDIFCSQQYIFGHGYRPIDRKDIKSVLVVDDSILTGRQMGIAKEKMRPLSSNYRIHYLAAISSDTGVDKVDIFLTKIRYPRIFQWNIMHSDLTEDACYDIDGVLCENPAVDDDGEKYIQYISNAIPRYTPKHKINMIVTCRLEKYRKITEEWLRNHNVSYRKLVMLGFNTKAERMRWGKHGEYKGEMFRKSRSKIFFESDYDQAKTIKDMNKTKMVFCTDRMEFV